MKKTIVIFIVCINQILSAQTEYTKTFNQIISKESKRLQFFELSELKKDEINVINQLIVYTKQLDNSIELKKSINLMYILTASSENKDIRKRSVEFFCEYLTYSQIDIQKDVQENLEMYNRTDFNSKSVKKIRLLIKKDKQLNQYLSLAKKLKITELIPLLKEKTKDTNIKKDTSIYNAKWQYNIALARLGDDDSEKYCLTLIKNKLKIKEEYRRLLDDLIEIGTPNSLYLLIQELEKEDILEGGLGCIPITFKKSLAAEVLQKNLVKYPFKDEFLTEKGINHLRTWIKSQPISALELE